MLLAPWFNYSHQVELGEVEWVGSGFVCSESTDKISIYFKMFFLLFSFLAVCVWVEIAGIWFISAPHDWAAWKQAGSKAALSSLTCTAPPGL